MNAGVATRTRGRVLIVEDDAGARGALVEILGMEGYEVEAASDGVSALAKLTAFKPALVLSDLRMPGMDGITFIKKAESLGKDFRLAIMSASRGARDIAAGFGADYVEKPIDLGRLLTVVDEATRSPAPSAGGY